MQPFFIARQPILCANGETFGYGLLFRSSSNNSYDPSVDGNTATSDVLHNAIVQIGLETLIGNALAFVNLTDRFLEEPELLALLPPGRCVLEVLETVVVTDKIVAGVEVLRAAGHLIALDDFVDDVQFARLLPLADIIKYDITQHSMQELEEYRKKDMAQGRRSLVERVETLEEFDELCGYGFDYFQGYYFSQPKIICGTKIPQNRVALMQLLAEVNNPTATIEDIAEIVGRDVSLGVRTLKYVNSPMNGLRAEVTSIQHATVLLGLEIIRNWVTLLVMSQMDDKPTELMKLALTRARFCQLVAKQNNLDAARYFTLGLLSLLDVFMDQSLPDALSAVTVNQDMCDELLNKSGAGGDMLRTLEALEKSEATGQASEEDMTYGQLYQAAILWCEETSSLLS